MTADQAEARPVWQEADGALACPRCGRVGLVTARFPHTWQGHTGKRICGFKEVVLCAECDGSEAAGALLELVGVHGEVRPQDAAVFIRLALAWVEAVLRRELDVIALVDEEQRWHSGEL
ncbi:DUF6300 family protein [Streptomyces sp. NPDC002446]